MISESETSSARLRWLCRRGMKELDIVLLRYLDRRYEVAPPPERAAFRQLLSHEDPEIWGWMIAQFPVPPSYADVVEHLRRHH